ncbi:hypothetical protein AALP_AA5G009100 [Arabis alpina]|uniref:AP180 N-terminal homology (ANTH) domain-containing protein n=1 Tax=Arabis alpina TaxID=50452 RepID=A0A087GU57_ARAAL|nr:hypothetical protein AALP_AA5G009100 [Arabis alpina]
MQRVIDLLMRIKPIGESMETPLVIEAMEYVINEILVIYDQICHRFAGFVSDLEKSPSEVVMKIAAKALSQREKLVKYFEICRDFGVRVNESDIDKLLRDIPANITAVTAVLEASSRRRDLISF